MFPESNPLSCLMRNCGPEKEGRGPGHTVGPRQSGTRTESQTSWGVALLCSIVTSGLLLPGEERALVLAEGTQGSATGPRGPELVSEAILVCSLLRMTWTRLQNVNTFSS